MLIIPPIPARRLRKAGPPLAPPPPPAALTLVTAAYDDVNLVLLLTFDRPVSLAAAPFDGAAIFVGDPTFNHTGYDGTAGPPVLDGPAIVRIFLNPTGEYFGTEVDFTASGATGIVAVDDGGTWAGTGGILFLPYP